MILLIGLLFSMIFCLQFTFLERLAEARGFMNIKVFFLVYAPTAIVLRIVFRRVPQQLGRTRVVAGGLTLQAVGVFFLVGIQTQGELVLPALLIGAGHCFVFPSMVDLAAERLPPDQRGTGTALILGAGDIGILTGFLVIGELIDRFGFDLALIALATTVLLGTALFAYTRRKFVLGRRGPT
jgi:predicted MFS family arabinose efflux permease